MPRSTQQGYREKILKFFDPIQHKVSIMKVSNFANPCGAETSADENRKALTQLIGNLLHDGFSTYKGLGIDPSNEWPGEESVVVPGLSFDRTKLLGAEFVQNAIVWAGPNAVPQLILLR